MPEKKTLAGRVDPEMEQRFEEYRETYNLNKSEALRRLVESGLEAEKSGPDQEDVEIGPLTNSERWFQGKFEKSLGLMLISAPITLSIWLGIGIAAQIWGMNASTWIPGQVLALLALLGIIVFLASLAGALLTFGAMKLGIPGWIERKTEQQANHEVA